MFTVANVLAQDYLQKRWNVVLKDKTVTVSLEKRSDSLYSIQLKSNDSLCDEWQLRYPVYEFAVCDVAEDSVPEIAVGVIKPTRFYPKPDRRLFLFRISSGLLIRPLWLGSRVAQPLHDFRLISTTDERRIRTIERERDGTFLVAEYKWRGFGLEFIRYLQREIPLEEAQKILQNN